MRKQFGVTLTEMMITIAIVAIVITTVAPGIQSVFIQNRIIGEINELSGVIQFARHTAIDQQADTVICPTQNFTSCTTNWNHAKMVFTDFNADGSRDANEELLVATSVIAGVNVMTGPAGSIRFIPSGGSMITATILHCHKDRAAKQARALMVTLQGRVRASTDADNDGVHEDLGGAALSC